MGLKVAEIFADFVVRDKTLFAAIDTLKRGAVEANKALSDMALKAGLALAALAATTYKVLSPFVEFQKTMSSVKALSNATASEFDALSKKARELGASTKFSGTQAAQAMEAFARKGLSVNDMLEASGPALDLAAAANLEMGEAAAIVTGIMNGMALEVKDLSKVVDALANVSTSSSNTVVMLGDAMAKAGPIGKTANQSLGDIVGTLAVLGDAMFQGAEGGTAFSAIVNRLRSGSDTTTEGLKRLGLVLSDLYNEDDGKFKRLPDIIDMLKVRLEAMNPEMRATTEILISGANHSAKFSKLIDMGSDKIRKYSEVTKKSGTASRIAAMMMDNLAGDMELLSGSVEELQLQLGFLLDTSLRKIVMTLSEFADKLAEIEDASKIAIIQLIALGAAMASLLVTVKLLTVTMALLLSPMNLILAALALTGVALLATSVHGETFADKMDYAFNDAGDAAHHFAKGMQVVVEHVIFGMAVMTGGVKSFGSTLTIIGASIMRWFASIGADFANFGGYIADWVIWIGGAFWDTAMIIKDVFVNIAENLMDLGAAMWDFAKNGFVGPFSWAWKQVEKDLKRFQNAPEWIGRTWVSAEEKFWGDMIKQAEGTLSTAIANEYEKLMRMFGLMPDQVKRTRKDKPEDRKPDAPPTDKPPSVEDFALGGAKAAAAVFVGIEEKSKSLQEAAVKGAAKTAEKQLTETKKMGATMMKILSAVKTGVVMKYSPVGV